ncbi:hypothetical protein V6Z12_A13G132200 [Gossypium hirsutum]
MTSFFFPGPSNHASFQIFIEVSFLTFQPVLRSNNTRAFQILCQVYERWILFQILQNTYIGQLQEYCPTLMVKIIKYLF